jgi:hypothetical protein
LPGQISTTRGSVVAADTATINETNIAAVVRDGFIASFFYEMVIW